LIAQNNKNPTTQFSFHGKKECGGEEEDEEEETNPPTIFWRRISMPSFFPLQFALKSDSIFIPIFHSILRSSLPFRSSLFLWV
jgi:hypothetical protein